MRKMLARLVACAGLVAVSALTPAAAQTFPSKPIRLIVPYPPGGGTDAIGRILAQRLSETLKQPVVVDNRAGASGMLGTDAVAKAAPDGYTLGIVISQHAVNPALFKDINYDAVKSFTPVSLLARGLYVVVVNPKFPANTMQEMISYAKANSGKINVAIAGAGNPGHLAVEELQLKYKIKFNSVTYKGSGPAVIDLVAGHVDMLVASFPGVQSFLSTNKLRGLAVTSANRSLVAPNLPTASEAGVPDFFFGEWYGIVGPAGMDKDIVSRLNGEIVKALVVPEVKERIQQLGAEIAGSSPQDFSSFISDELSKQGTIVRDANIKLD